PARVPEPHPARRRRARGREAPRRDRGPGADALPAAADDGSEGRDPRVARAGGSAAPARGRGCTAGGGGGRCARGRARDGARRRAGRGVELTKALVALTVLIAGAIGFELFAIRAFESKLAAHGITATGPSLEHWRFVWTAVAADG